MDQQLLTVSQLAEEWNCSEDFIYRRCRKGHPQYIPHVRLTPRDIRFDPKVIAGLNSGIDPAIRMKRVGHATARTNLIYSHPDLALQKAAPDAIWQRLQLAKQKLKNKEKEEGSKAPLSSLSVTLSVTPNQAKSLSY